jgi:hypothetical protein
MCLEAREQLDFVQNRLCLCERMLNQILESR